MRCLVVLPLLAAAGLALAADLAATAEKIRSNLPTNVELASIEPDDDKLILKGTAGENRDVAALMRYLDDQVGSPTLESLHRKDGTSTFFLTVKPRKSE